MNERQKTIQDMKDNLLRLQALEDHAKMFCNKFTHSFVSHAIEGLKHAIEIEEVSK